MRNPGPTPGTTSQKVEYDKATFLVVFGPDDKPEKISVKLNRRGPTGVPQFYGWRAIWEEGTKMTARDQIILELCVSSNEEERV